MTPDTETAALLHACDVAAMDGKLRDMAQGAQGMLDTCLMFGKLTSEAKCYRKVIDTCNECRRIIAHAQKPLPPLTQERLEELWAEWSARAKGATG